MDASTKDAPIVSTDACSAARPAHTVLACALLAAVIAAIYLIGSKYLFETDQTLVPFGDSFTYTIFLFRALNAIHEGIGVGIATAANGTFLWLQGFLTVLLSPFLYNERSSIILINYFFLLVTSVLILRTAMLARVAPLWSFCLTLVFICAPWNINAHMEFNLTSLMPDPLFFNAFVLAILVPCWWLSAPQSLGAAVATGLALGIAVWARGNSFIYCGLLLPGFGAVVFARLYWARNQILNAVTLRRLAVVVAVAVVMTAVYFLYEFNAIYDYYFGVASSVLFDVHKKLAGAKWIIRNMPGLALAGGWYYGAPTPRVVAVGLTLTAHAAAIASLIIGFRKLRGSERAELLTGALGVVGGSIFYVDLVFALFTFSGFYSDPEFRDPHTFEPAFAGITCCALSLLFAALRGREPKRDPSYAYFAIGAFAAILATYVLGSTLAEELKSHYSSTPSTPCDDRVYGQRYLPARDMSRLSGILSAATTKKFVAYLWYGLLNSQILQYYTVQRNEAEPRELPLPNSELFDYWLSTFNPEVLTPEPKFRSYLQRILKEAEFVVIPETLGAYDEIWPCAIVAYHQDIADAINSAEAPDYVVWATVEDNNTRALILKRREASDTSFDVFPRTWGTSKQIIGRTFKGAFNVSTKPVGGPGTSSVTVLFSLNGYNIMRVGSRYVAASQRVGALDPSAILSGAAPRPRPSDFIVATDLESLRSEISVCRPD
jgi:hypothetical protein